ncbi:pyridoxine/pyridoxamine 5'-phosphate oxidase [Nitrincola sp. A-D6]|uniref:pyridoxine/pyridoxamine 5'-phosphate oxidase n=1 Tax=Nitrincola sp. A-D6 TaxID=1545442 RepID=UPI000A562147|nr:pyridoxamine 5'-phosphate oxidase family protein [Nitrincola sp. A-D6]
MSQDTSDLKSLRREYEVGDLNQDDLSADPVQQFGRWFEQALAQYADEATAMTLATADAEGMPSARIVLLKQYDKQGFTWFTDYRSEKGQQLAINPQAELLFFWPACLVRSECVDRYRNCLQQRGKPTLVNGQPGAV